MSDPLIENPVPTFNPPPGWKSSAPPAEPHEEAILREEFGEPINGVYAPYVGDGFPLDGLCAGTPEQWANCACTTDEPCKEA